MPHHTLPIFLGRGSGEWGFQIACLIIAIYGPLFSPVNTHYFGFLVSPIYCCHPSKTQGAFSRCAAIMNSDLGTGLLTLAESLEGGRCWVFYVLHHLSLPNSPCPEGKITILKTNSKVEATEQCSVEIPTG